MNQSLKRSSSKRHQLSQLLVRCNTYDGFHQWFECPITYPRPVFVWRSTQLLRHSKGWNFYKVETWSSALFCIIIIASRSIKNPSFQTADIYWWGGNLITASFAGVCFQLYTQLTTPTGTGISLDRFALWLPKDNRSRLIRPCRRCDEQSIGYIKHRAPFPTEEPWTVADPVFLSKLGINSGRECSGFHCDFIGYGLEDVQSGWESSICDNPFTSSEFTREYRPILCKNE